MRKFLPHICLLLLLTLALFLRVPVNHAQNCSSEEECRSLISQYEQKLTTLRAQKSSLAAEVDFANTQIYLTTLRIQETENKIAQTAHEIENLGSRIEGLNSSLDQLTRILLAKIVEGYKNRDDISALHFILDADNASVLGNKIKYMKTAQENDSRIAFRVQQAKLNFEEQRDLREEKKIELDKLTVTLDQQKAALDAQKIQKQRLLEDTQNDEQKYQSLLAAARAEFAAIQGIVSGAGTETFLRDVSKGQNIATVISGASCNSSGSHLHFIVQEGGSVNNPFNYLKSVDHVNDSNGDEFNPSGSWDWPIPPTITMHQGYGNTWFVRTYGWYSFHNGIDITGASSSVTSVADGQLYRGSYSGSGGCALSYVKVTHKDSNISTLYLHVYPN